jgi:hypothetical protein
MSDPARDPRSPPTSSTHPNALGASGDPGRARLTQLAVALGRAAAREHWAEVGQREPLLKD